MTKDRDKFQEVKPDMTPMIDVTFLLLIFFIVTLKFKTLEGRLDAALPKDGQLLPDPATSTKSYPYGRLRHVVGRVLKVEMGAATFNIRTDLDADNNGILDDLVKLDRAMDQFDKEETPVTLDPRKNVVYGDMVGLLDLVIRQGFTKISFAGSLEND
jgi:biopolymer transport protein ExbD